MKAVQISKTGGPSVLDIVELAVPRPGRREVLVRIVYAGVNFIDIYHREGRYPAPLPLIPGQEASGLVVELGEDVTHFKIGDRVAWRGGFGAYAEYAAVSTNKLVTIPAKVTFEQAAAVMTQGLTAHYLAHSAYPIQARENVLIHAGAGGTGLLLIQIAKMRGARVLTTVSNQHKAVIAREAGADDVILYTEEPFRERVKSLLSGSKLPVVYDSVGRSTFEGSLACLSRRGVLVLFGASSGSVPPVDLMRLANGGSLYVTRPVLNDYIATRAELEKRAGEVFAWVENGALKLRISNTFPLHDVQSAHRALESRANSGKLLLQVCVCGGKARANYHLGSAYA